MTMFLFLFLIKHILVIIVRMESFVRAGTGTHTSTILRLLIETYSLAQFYVCHPLQ